MLLCPAKWFLNMGVSHRVAFPFLALVFVGVGVSAAQGAERCALLLPDEFFGPMRSDVTPLLQRKGYLPQYVGREEAFGTQYDARLLLYPALEAKARPWFLNVSMYLNLTLCRAAGGPRAPVFQEKETEQGLTIEAAFVPSLRCQIIASAQESKLMSMFSLKDEDPHDLMGPLVTKAVTAMPSCSEAEGS